MVVLRPDLRPIAGATCTSGYYKYNSFLRPDPDTGSPALSFTRSSSSPPRLTALHAEKPSVCTADELHYVPVSNSNWKLALWRYTPSTNAPRRNHPLLLLSGVGTNAIGYDLSPESSFARYMSGEGFDTWVLELRGAGLSSEEVDFEEAERRLDEYETSPSQGNKMKIVSRDEPSVVPNLVEASLNLFERFSGFIRGEYVSISNVLRDLRGGIRNLVERQDSVPPQFVEFQQSFSDTLEDFEKQIDMIVKYDWDFDHYLEEDVPAAMEYIRAHCEPKDRKLLAIGHSMGGILLYAMLSRFGFEGKDTGLTAVATLGSTLDYTSSRSSLKVLLPLVDPAQALNVPVIPIGALLTTAHPFASRPPYIFAGLTAQISAQNMHPGLLEKLVFKNFGTVPAKLLLQLSTAFRHGGLCDRSGTFLYKDHIGKTNVPVLAIAGDQDLICPPEAVHETAKFIPKNLLEYKVFGNPKGPHYGHYDLVGGVTAGDHVYPCIINFLNRYDKIMS